MTTSVKARIIGIDLARFLAIVGMMAAHLLVPMGNAPAWVEIVSSGFPSSLFAVLGGFGVVFASRKQQGFSASVGIFVRGIVVVFIGWLMELLPDHNIAVVLVYFGTAIAVSAFIVNLPSWGLVLIAAILSLGGAQLNAWYRIEVYDAMPGLLDYRHFFESVFITGTYPVLTWIVYMLIGIIMARWMLAMRSGGKLTQAATWMLVGGAIVSSAAYIFGEAYVRMSFAPTVARLTGESTAMIRDYVYQSSYGAPIDAGFAAWMLPTPHSGTLIDIAHTGGAAIAIIGACLLATASLTTVPWLIKPVLSAGAAPLTIYVLHVAMTAFMYVGLNAFDLSSPPGYVQWAFWWQLVVVLAVGGLLAATRQRGPLELLVSNVSKAAAGAMTPGQSQVPDTDLQRQ